MRNRIFVREAGLEPTVLTFSARADHAERRAVMLERGLLLPEIATPNIYEHYRESGWNKAPGGSVRPVDVSRYTPDEEMYQDGSPWRISYRDADGQVVLFDYLRADGKPYLRIPSFIFKKPMTWPHEIQRLAPDGTVLGSFPSLGHWFKNWIRELADGERSFVFVDSRFNAQHVIPIQAPNIHLIYMLHNIHVLAPRLWSSPTTAIYGRLLRRIDGMDAMVTLTGRQRDDIALRRGRTNNLFVVPNPVEMPRPAQPHPRDPNLVAVVARLEEQKALTDAIQAFALVHREVPLARLDIYGDGSQRPDLQKAIDDLGLASSITLKGHHPEARNALRTASAFLVTSEYEGWNLAMQESMSHGCPVVSYDVKYGPREQIEDGVNGFLVPAGNQSAMAERVIQLLQSVELVETLGSRALEKTRHSKDRFARDWEDVLQTVVDRKPYRTRIEHVRMDVTRFRIRRTRRVQRLFRPKANFASVGSRGHDQLTLQGVLSVAGRSEASSMDSVDISLASVHLASGVLIELPMTVRRDGDRFMVSSQFAIEEAVEGAPPDAVMRLRITLVWGNSSWQGFVKPQVDGVFGLLRSRLGRQRARSPIRLDTGDGGTSRG